MFIYKVTNKNNGKMYIGQTNGTVSRRWHRHCSDALSNTLDTHFARAIRKYGKDAFTVETIDTATSNKELTEKEYYWIDFYKATENGYNETDAMYKCGGNTYKSKTEDEMKIIKEKIRETKIGGKNPQSVSIKMRNEETGEELFFDSQADAMRYFGETNHQFVSRRCRGQITQLYKGCWNIAYADKEYNSDATKEKKQYRAKRVIVKNLETEEELEFPSFAAAERYFGLRNKALSSKAYLKGNHFIQGNFEVTKVV